MKQLLSRPITWALGVLTLLLLPCVVQAQFLLTPQPGEIFKEYSRVNASSSQWRVTDPNTTNTSAQQYLPNAVLPITIDDLSGAVRAEALIQMWGGHVGTSNKRIRFNGNTWINIPELGAASGIPAGTNGQCYMTERNPVVAIPLSNLRSGSNSVEGTTGNQTCYSFNWGQWGFYGVVVRVYYGSSKPHPTGSITSPSAGNTFGDNPVVNVSTSGSVSEVRVIAYHDGFDPDGDGVRRQYNYSYHRYLNESTMFMKHHVGTDNSAPYSMTWNNALVPDQSGIKLMALIKGTDGTIYATNEVTNLTLDRTGAYVRMYTVQMPERFIVRNTRGIQSVTFTIPSGDPISNASSATLVIPSWNGDDVSERPGFNTKVNTWTTPLYGFDHYFKIDFITVPLSALRQGTNTITVTYQGVEHGIEYSWPGPTMFVRFGGTASNQPPSITQHPVNQSVAVGQTATFTVGASGTAPLSYQWQKNSANISGATSASYTTPGTTSGDNGATFRCVVTNPYGNATSNSATLTVTSGDTPPSITQQPQNRTVSVGQTATFSVTATGTAPLSYQWQRNGTAITGAQSASHTTPATTLADNGSTYLCVVTNAYGSVTSNSVTLTVTETPPPPAGNVVQNPGFENGTDPWRFYTNGAGTFTSVTPGREGSRAGRVAITTEGTNVQLYQSGLQLQPDTEYRLTFFAYSSGGRDLSVSLLKNESPYTGYGLSNGVANLTTAWNEFSFTFRTTGFSGPVSDARLRFWLAPYDAPGEVYYIDGVSLAPTTTPPPVSNLFENGGFESGTAPWQFHTNGTGTLAAVTPGFTGASAGRVSIVAAGTNMQLYQSGFLLQAGARYRLTFSAYSSTGHDLAVSIHRQTSPYTAFGLSNAVFNLTTAYQTFTREFTATGFTGTTTDTRVRFWFVGYGVAGDQYFIDDVALEKISATAGDPTFAGETGEIGGNLLDAAGIPQDFSLGANYPNPFNPSTNIAFSLPEDAEVRLAVYNTLGQELAILAEGAYGPGQYSVLWDARLSSGSVLSSGVYLYRITAAGKSGKVYSGLQKMVLMK